MIDNQFLENVEWFIENKPSVRSMCFRDTSTPLKKSDCDRIVLDFKKDIRLRMPLSDDYSIIRTININGRQTLLSLFMHIYNFYQKQIDRDTLEDAFKEYPDILSDILDSRNGNQLKCIVVFSGSVCAPDFVGLEESEPFSIDDPEFTVNLGPI
jgi:hypothetical protein